MAGEEANKERRTPPKDPKELRTGYTTGSCATAATKAALLMLVHQRSVEQVEITLPIGKRVTFNLTEPSFNQQEARCAVIKDGGDDPDATHGAWIYATVSWHPEPGLHLDGGEGVGRVTKPGLALEVGMAAINPVPRKMIRQVVEEIMGERLAAQGVKVIISVPNGEEIARKTMNGRLGIIGGISILGTQGIVVPFSTAAYKASVIQGIDVAVANGCRELVLTTGGRSEQHAMKLYPLLAESAFIEMGDFVGYALKRCARHEEVEKVIMVGMMGKFSKVAAGHFQVHSKSSFVDFNFLARVAEEAGAPEALLPQILQANTAGQVGTMMEEAGCTRFFELLCAIICQRARDYMGREVAVEMTLTTMNGKVLGRNFLPAGGMAGGD